MDPMTLLLLAILVLVTLNVVAAQLARPTRQLKTPLHN
jgi:hypothetical protein